MFTFKQIYRAYIDCRKNKRNKPDALEFEVNQEEKLSRLVAALNDRSYQPATSVCFYVEKPKGREIFAADFQDRIIHHLIYNELAPVWEKIFIDQSFACRPGKGTHRAAKMLQSYLRKITRNGKKTAYYLKLDIKNFFMSINKMVLYRLLCKKCKNEGLKWLLKVVIFHDPTRDYELRSSKRLKKKIPQQKSLFYALENCGLPIGNLTSQFFANVYLNALDQFVKHVLKCRFYVRYVDDFILLATDKNQLLQWQQQIIKFLDDELLLQLNHAATKIDSIFNGVDFVGFIVRPFYMLCRRRVIGNLNARLKQFEEILVHVDNNKIIWHYDYQVLEQLLATVNSYLGHFRYARMKKMIIKIFTRFSFVNEYFFLYFRRMVRRYQLPKRIQTLKQQVKYFRKQFIGHLIFFQVGCYYEAYGRAADQLATVMNYQIQKKWRGFNRACGFHQRFLERVCHELEKQKISYAIIKQSGRYLNQTMERVPFLRVEFKKL